MNLRNDLNPWGLIRGRLRLKPPILVAPRFHTNLGGWAESLHRAGIPARVLVARVSHLENHRDADVLKVNGWEPPLVFRKKWDDWARSRWFLPSIPDMWGGLVGAKHRTLIVRDRTLLSIVAYLIFRLRGGSESYLYCQESIPSFSGDLHSSRYRIRRFLREAVTAYILPREMVSPIWSIDGSFSFPENFPFLIESRFFETGKARLKNPVIADKPNLLIVGKYRPYKNMFELVDWLAENGAILEKLNKVTILGECQTDGEKAYRAKLCGHLERLQIAGKVVLIANVKNSRMHHVYEENDIFLLPSHNEVASISVLEAAASALAVLTPESNGTACYFTDFPEQRFSWGNKEDLRLKLISLAGDPEVLYRNRMSSYMAVQRLCVGEIPNFYR